MLAHLVQTQRERLQQRVAAAATPHERVDALNALAWFERDFDLHASRALCDRAYALATHEAPGNARYTRGAIASLRTSGYLHTFMGLSEQSAEESLRALELMESVPCPEMEMDVRCNLIWAYLQMGEMEQAMQYAMPAYETARARDDKWGQVLMLDAIGYIYTSMGEAAEALANSQRALDLLRALGDLRGEGAELNNIANHYLLLGDYERALECVNASLTLTDAHGYHLFYVNALGTAGEIYLAQQEYSRAIATFEECLRHAQANEMHLAWVINKFLLGQTYFRIGDMASAAHSVRDALERAVAHKIRLYEANCHQLLAEILEQQGDFENALRHFKAFQALREQIIFESSRRVTSLTTLLRLKETQQTLEQSHRETEMLQAELREHQQLRETLFALATQDPLVGILNRRRFVELAAPQVQKNTEGNGFALLLFDVDHFKHVNDSFGHSVGDQVLKWVVERVQQHLRAHDLLARLGGDEFALWLPDTSARHAYEIAERLRLSVESRTLYSAQTYIHVSLSIGATYCPPGRHADLDTLLQTADRALYRAKRNGRNQTCMTEYTFSES
jgi:diguanylate cyclase (GGDEF)-like protein